MRVSVSQFRKKSRSQLRKTRGRMIGRKTRQIVMGRMKMRHGHFFESQEIIGR